MAALITMPRLMSVGGGALAELPALMARLGLKHPLVVTDPYIALWDPRPRDRAARQGAAPVVGVLRYGLRSDDRGHRDRCRDPA